MKKGLFLFFSLAAIFSCQKALEPEQSVNADTVDYITAVVADELTKTTATSNAGGYDFNWAKGDKIGVIALNASSTGMGIQTGTNLGLPYQYTLVGEGGGKTASFVSDNPVPAGSKYIAVYPYSTTSSTGQSSYCTGFSSTATYGDYIFYLPSVQTYAENGVNTDYNIMYAVSDDKSKLEFHHLSSVLRLNLKTSESYTGVRVKQIVVTATSLTRPSICEGVYFHHSYSTADSYSYLNVYSNKNKTITLNCNYTELTTTAKEFNIVFNPIAGGLTTTTQNITLQFDIVTDRGTITKTKTFVASRGVVYTMPTLEVNLDPVQIYSFNNGAQNSANLDSKVEGTDNFTKLSIEPTDVTGELTFSADDFAKINTYINTYGSSAGVELDLSKINYEKTEFPTSFANNAKLKKLYFPKNILSADGSKFSNCTLLSDIVFDSKLNKLWQGVFNNMPAFTTLDLTPCTNLSQILWPGSTGCMIQNVIVDNGSFVAVDGVVYDNNTNALVWVPCQNTAAVTSGVYNMPAGVTTIRQAAFFNNKTISKIVFDSSFTTIYGGYNFGGSSITILDFSLLSSVPTFVNCTGSDAFTGIAKSGELWCADADMLESFDNDSNFNTLKTSYSFTFKVKPVSMISTFGIGKVGSSETNNTWN